MISRMTDLTTTNILLGIMAAVSLFEALAIIGLLVGGYRLYRRTLRVVTDIEERQIAPLTARVNAILDDVKGVTSVVESAAKDADVAARGALGWLVNRLKVFFASL
jgi:hypothetical protein